LPAAVRGAVWMTLAAVFFAALIVSIRVLSADFSPYENLFFRAVFGTILLLPAVFRMGWSHYGTRRLSLHGVRGLTMWIAMIVWYFALANLSLADAVALQFTLPLFMVLLSALFLGEATRPMRWVLLLVGFAGTLIILRPGFVEIGLPTLAALSSAFFLRRGAHDEQNAGPYRTRLRGRLLYEPCTVADFGRGGDVRVDDAGMAAFALADRARNIWQFVPGLHGARACRRAGECGDAV